MRFMGVSCPKKRLLPGLRPGDLPLPKKSISPLLSAFGFNIWPRKTNSLSVTPISGYVYVTVRNNKQYR